METDKLSLIYRLVKTGVISEEEFELLLKEEEKNNQVPFVYPTTSPFSEPSTTSPYPYRPCEVWCSTSTLINEDKDDALIEAYITY